MPWIRFKSGQRHHYALRNHHDYAVFFYFYNPLYNPYQKNNPIWKSPGRITGAERWIVVDRLTDEQLLDLLSDVEWYNDEHNGEDWGFLATRLALLELAELRGIAPPPRSREDD